MTTSTEQAGGERATRGRVPDFFIVGHAKSGTTALYDMLRRHPQIYMSSNKEPQFFARNPQAAPVHARKNSFEQTGRRVETLEDYLSLFAAAGPDQLVGDASTFYLWSRTAPKRIAQAQPGARIIAILREPASFLSSLHLQMLQNHSETEKDLRKAIALEQERRRGRHIPRSAYWPEALMYSQRVRYVEQLRRYHALFHSEQVLVLIYDDFRADNEGTVRRVLRFLEVDDTVPVEMVNANPTVGVRSVRLRGMVGAVRKGQGPIGGAVKAAAIAVTTSRLRREVLHPLRHRVVYGPPQPPHERLMLELRRRFKGEVEALSEYLGRDLVALWGYEQLP
jgi:sulfotransferase family protein